MINGVARGGRWGRSPPPPKMRGKRKKKKEKRNKKKRRKKREERGGSGSAPGDHEGVGRLEVKPSGRQTRYEF